MDFDKPNRVRTCRRFTDLFGMETECAQSSIHCDAFGILEREKRGGKASSDRAATNKWHAVAHTLFFRKCDDLDGQRQLKFLRKINPLKRQRDAEHAVECACIGHGIDVRAKDEALRACARGLPQAAQIAGRVDADGHVHRLHARTKMRMNIAHRRRQKPSRNAARLFAHGGDGLAFSNGSLCTRFHWRTNSIPLGDPRNPSWLKICSARSQVSRTFPRNSAPR